MGTLCGLDYVLYTYMDLQIPKPWTQNCTPTNKNPRVVSQVATSRAIEAAVSIADIDKVSLPVLSKESRV